MKRLILFALLAAGLLAGAVIPLMAHHSFAAFDVTTQKTVTGTVKQSGLDQSAHLAVDRCAQRKRRRRYVRLRRYESEFPRAPRLDAERR